MKALAFRFTGLLRRTHSRAGGGSRHAAWSASFPPAFARGILRSVNYSGVVSGMSDHGLRNNHREEGRIAFMLSRLPFFPVGFEEADDRGRRGDLELVPLGRPPPLLAARNAHDHHYRVDPGQVGQL